MARAMRAWGEVKPKAILVMSRIFWLTVIWSSREKPRCDLHSCVGHMSTTHALATTGSGKSEQ